MNMDLITGSTDKARVLIVEDHPLFREGLALLINKQPDMIKRALQADPNNGAYLDSLGWVEYRQGKFDQALNDLHRAAQNITHDDPVVFDHIGDACLKLNKVAQALEAWQKAAGLDPNNKQIAEKIENAKTKMSKGVSGKANPME